MPRRKMSLASPIVREHESLNSFEVERIDVGPMGIVVYLNPPSAGAVSIYADGSTEVPGKKIIVLNPAGTVKLNQFLSLIEDAVKANLELP